jgi:hypothetical protein
VVASVVLTAALALVAVPGPAGSQPPSGNAAVGPERLQPVRLDAARTGTVSYVPDPALRSASALEAGSVFREPAATSAAPARPPVDVPSPTPGSIDLNPWRLDGNVSWYGPGFYGNRTACGVAYTETVVGVAHRTLPCGTRILFRNPANGRVVAARVIDRGPYVAGRHWDLSAGLCRALAHCYTGSLSWKYG